VIDIHCHLLPGIDDGAKSWEVALKMCRMAANDGIAHIVATPHANYEYPYDRARYAVLLDELRAQVPELTFSLGCDFHLSYENVSDCLQHPERYAIGETNYLLVELSEYSSYSVAETLYQLRAKGLTPIVTHPERNQLVLSTPTLLDDFARVGALFQITANALTGSWGKPSQKFAETMLKKNMVHFIASDAHGVGGRPPILSAGRDAAAKIVGEAVARELVDTNPAAVVCGQPLSQTTR
jgi:protein-tyrosine phosphatase